MTSFTAARTQTCCQVDFGGDHLDGGQGTDAANYSDSNAGVTIDLGLFLASGGSADGDTLQSIEEVIGSEHNDRLTGNALENSFYGSFGKDTFSGLAGDDGLWGGAGNDMLEGGLDADHIDGGEGNDTATYQNASEGVAIRLDGVNIQTGEAEGDQLVSIERLVGSEFGDVLGGSTAANRLTGLGGSDMLYGLDGNDDLFGGQGQDLLLGGEGSDDLEGGTGADIFAFVNLASGGDTISDFGTGADLFQFESAAFGGLPLGTLGANRFLANNSGEAVTAGQRFIYETDTGILRHDANGSANGGVTIIATLTGAPELTALQIEIVNYLSIL